MILGIFLAMNIFPVIYGFVTMEEGDDFLTGFLFAWGIELIIGGFVGVIILIVWLIATGWTMMQAPGEIY